MRVEYRKKYPYFGKYKIKIHVYNRNWIHHTVPLVANNNRGVEAIEQQKVLDHLKSVWLTEKDYKWKDAWNVYLRDEDVFDDVSKKFPDSICTVIRPAPGYEDLEGVGKIEEHVLWFDKFPYRIGTTIGRGNNNEAILWCNSNIESDYRVSTGTNASSFYFMTSFDTMAFKLRFSDSVTKTGIANKKQATESLKKRIEIATREYNEYLEGEK